MAPKAIQDIYSDPEVISRADPNSDGYVVPNVRYVSFLVTPPSVLTQEEIYM